MEGLIKKKILKSLVEKIIKERLRNTAISFKEASKLTLGGIVNKTTKEIKWNHKTYSIQKNAGGDFPGGPVVKTSPS